MFGKKQTLKSELFEVQFSVPVGLITLYHHCWVGLLARNLISLICYKSSYILSCVSIAIFLFLSFVSCSHYRSINRYQYQINWVKLYKFSKWFSKIQTIHHSKTISTLNCQAIATLPFHLLSSNC